MCLKINGSITLSSLLSIGRSLGQEWSRRGIGKQLFMCTCSLWCSWDSRRGYKLCWELVSGSDTALVPHSEQLLLHEGQDGCLWLLLVGVLQ